jgi:hypothetical protein
MTYRNCIIHENTYCVYEWYHPDRVDWDTETGSVWSGFGQTVEECMKQIDDYYEDFER